MATRKRRSKPTRRQRKRPTLSPGLEPTGREDLEVIWLDKDYDAVPTLVARGPNGEFDVWRLTDSYTTPEEAERDVNYPKNKPKSRWALWEPRDRIVNARRSDENPSKEEERATEVTLNKHGWSVGWDDEISAHAAVSDSGSDKLVMTANEWDSAPRSMDDEVVVGLYKWDEDEGWEQIGYADFDSVSEVLALGKTALKRKLMSEVLEERRVRRRFPR